MKRAKAKAAAAGAAAKCPAAAAAKKKAAKQKKPSKANANAEAVAAARAANPGLSSPWFPWAPTLAQLAVMCVAALSPGLHHPLHDSFNEVCTPLCSRCEDQHGACRFCCRVHSCTPPAHRRGDGVQQG